MKSIDFSKMITAEQRQEQERHAALEAVLASRRAAYLAESDPLRFEADYDALSQGREPDYAGWLSSVEAIKSRYPLPTVAAD